MGLITLNGEEGEVPEKDSGCLTGEFDGGWTVKVEGWGGGVVMSHPDSYGQSLTQPENIFHTLNTAHPIKLSINYFNPQIKDSTKCLMFICSAHLFIFLRTCSALIQATTEMSGLLLVHQTANTLE